MSRKRASGDYPREITYNGKRYKLTPDFHNVLAFLKDAREFPYQDILLVRYLTKNAPPECASAVMDALFPHAKNTDKERSFDFVQDWDLIYSAFWQQYGIDLNTTPMHWHQFMALLQGLTDQTLFVKVCQIRSRPIPPPQKGNEQARNELLRLKNLFKLKLSPEEQDENLQRGLRQFVQSIGGIHG